MRVSVSGQLSEEISGAHTVVPGPHKPRTNKDCLKSHIQKSSQSGRNTGHRITNGSWLTVLECRLRREEQTLLTLSPFLYTSLAFDLVTCRDLVHFEWCMLPRLGSITCTGGLISTAEGEAWPTAADEGPNVVVAVLGTASVVGQALVHI